MNKEFLKRQMWVAHYSLKQGTTATYIFLQYLPIEALQDKKQKKEATSKMIARMQSEGKEMLLPFRICFITGEGNVPVCNVGRGTRKKVAQMKSSFTLPERSPYKIAKPYKVCTSQTEVHTL